MRSFRQKNLEKFEIISLFGISFRIQRTHALAPEKRQRSALAVAVTATDRKPRPFPHGRRRSNEHACPPNTTRRKYGPAPTNVFVTACILRVCHFFTSVVTSNVTVTSHTAIYSKIVRLKILKRRNYSRRYRHHVLFFKCNYNYSIFNFITLGL